MWIRRRLKLDLVEATQRTLLSSLKRAHCGAKGAVSFIIWSGTFTSPNIVLVRVLFRLHYSVGVLASRLCHPLGVPSRLWARSRLLSSYVEPSGVELLHCRLSLHSAPWPLNERSRAKQTNDYVMLLGSRKDAATGNPMGAFHSRRREHEASAGAHLMI